MIQRPHQTDREFALRKYFEIVTKPAITTPAFLAAGGILLAIICLAEYYQQGDSGADNTTAIVLLLIVGLTIAVVGGIQMGSIQARYSAALHAIQPQPSDSEVDTIFQESLDKLLQHSKNILSLFGSDREFSEPLVIEVPTLTSTYGVPPEDLKWQKGKDGTLRFSIHNFIVIYLTERHLAAYTCDFNFIRDVPLNESTREYHYQDIISVATYEWSEALNEPTGQKHSNAQIFRLAIASGENIEVRIERGQLRQMTKEEDVPTIGLDQTVKTIRAMVREKKA